MAQVNVMGLVKLAYAFLGLAFLITALYRKLNWVPVLFSTLGTFIVFSLPSPLLLFVGWEIVSWTIFFSILRGRSEEDRALTVPAVASRKYVVYVYIFFAALSVVFLLLWMFLSGFSYQSRYFFLAVLASVVKSAIIPFHLWLVPTYASLDFSFTAFNSGVLSKLGLILIVLPLYYRANHGGDVISSFGLSHDFVRTMIILSSFTALYAAYKAVLSEDLVELLSYSSLSQVGYIFSSAFLSLISRGEVSSMALNGAFLHTLNHALVKIPFFMLAYFVYRKYGTTSLSEIGGLYRKSPLLFFLILPLAISLAGVPPMGGFVSKWLIYTSMLKDGQYLSFVFLGVAGVLSFLYVYRFLHSLFFERLKNRALEADRFEELRYHLLPSGLAAAFALFTGVFPSFLLNLWAPALPEGMTFDLSGYLPATSIGFAFMGLVVFAVFLWFISAPNRYVPDTDNYTAVAVKLEQHPEIAYDYSYGFFKPMARPVRWLSWVNPEKLYDVLVGYFTDTLNFVRSLASGRFTDYLFYVSVFLFAMLFVGRVLNAPWFYALHKISAFLAGGK